MEGFLSSNPGLSSRFASRIAFPDYLVEELGAILLGLAQREGYALDDQVLKKATNYLDSLRRHEEHFGNGRSVRNLFGEMKMNLARRLMKRCATEQSLELEKEALITFRWEDVPDQENLASASAGSSERYDLVKFSADDYPMDHARIQQEQVIGPFGG